MNKAEQGRPSRLRVEIITHRERCFHVSFSAAEPEVFSEAVLRLKNKVPRVLRSYDCEGKVWNFRPEAKQAFDAWLSTCVREWRAEVVRRDG